MPKISETIKLKHIPTSIEGVFARNMPQAVLRIKMEQLQETANLDENAMELMTLYVFKEFVCDENGESFEDCMTIEGIENSMDIKTTLQIITEVPNAYVPSEKALGN